MDKPSLTYVGAAAGAVALAYYATKKPPQIDLEYNFAQQSVEIDVCIYLSQNLRKIYCLELFFFSF